MQKILINNEGIYFSAWESEGQNWINRKISDVELPISYYLGYAVEIEEGLTLKRLLEHLAKYADQIQLIFAGSLIGIDFAKLPDLMQELEDKPTNPGISAVCLIKIGEAIELEEESEDGPFLRSYPVLMGLEMIGDDGEEDKFHSLTTIDFKEWCNLQLVADDYFEYVDPITEEVLFNGVFNWSLYDLLTAIFAQITVTVQIQTSEKSSQPGSGPILIKHVFDWLDDLDKIMI